MYRLQPCSLENLQWGLEKLQCSAVVALSAPVEIFMVLIEFGKPGKAVTTFYAVAMEILTAKMFVAAILELNRP